MTDRIHSSRFNTNH
jgi:hypothetical protein